MTPVEHPSPGIMERKRIDFAGGFLLVFLANI